MNKKKIEVIPKVALIIHPIKVNNVKNDFRNFYSLSHVLMPFISNISNDVFENLYSKLPIHKFLEVKNIISLTNRRIDLLVIMCPLFPEQLLTMNQNVALRKIIDSCNLAKRLGAKIIVLGGFTSIIGNEGDEVAKEIDIAVTSGNTYTAALAIQGISKAAELLDKKMNESTLAVIGATGDIGSICSRVLSKRVKNVILCARKIEESSDFIDDLKKKSKAKISIEKYADKAAGRADFILTATSATTTIIEPKNLMPKTIICDISIPPNIAREVAMERKDVFVFDGGKAKLAFPQKIKNRKWHIFAPNNSVYGCLAEALILAFEKKFENFSIGRGNITEEKIDEISHLAKKHGISLADFSCAGRLYKEQEIKDLFKK